MKYAFHCPRPDYYLKSVDEVLQHTETSLLHFLHDKLYKSS